MTHPAIRAAEALGFPTEGAFAWRLWELCSACDGLLGIASAAQLYRDCGYIPFCGYPLTRNPLGRSGKIPAMTREECEAELASNPWCQLERGE